MATRVYLIVTACRRIRLTSRTVKDVNDRQLRYMFSTHKIEGSKPTTPSWEFPGRAKVCWNFHFILSFAENGKLATQSTGEEGRAGGL